MSEAVAISERRDLGATRLIRLREVQYRVGLGRSTIYRWMTEGRFPKPVRLGGHAVAWKQDEIDCWISQRSGS